MQTHHHSDVDLNRRRAMLGAVGGMAATAAPAFSSETTAGLSQIPVHSGEDLRGKRALVTGASRGIGAGIALALAERGADVAITYLRSTEKAGSIVRSIEQKGRRGLAIQADSADAAAVRRSVAQTVEAFVGLDILVNNVGISRSGSLAEMNFSDIDADQSGSSWTGRGPRPRWLREAIEAGASLEQFKV